MERSLLSQTWAELKRRRVVRVGVTYAVVAWVVLQVAEVTFEPLGLPPRVMTWTVLGVVLGFPVALVLSWFFDASARGIKREQGIAGAGSAAFFVAMVLLAVGGVAWWLHGVYAPANVQPTDAVLDGATPINDAPSNSVGVLPFDDLSPGADQGFLADGIAEELLDRLARNPGLKVAARTSSFALRGLAQDARAHGRQLGVRWLLEGSLRKASGRVRVTAQLIDTRSGFHVWSDTYERPDQDLFALQDEVAIAIAGELSERIEGVVAEAPAEPDTANPEALQVYLQGRQAWRQRTADSLERAETLFQQAVALDPEFARAWSGLADTYLLQADYGRLSDADAIRLAEPAAVRAVELRPMLGEAWASLGLLRMTAGQYRAAQSSLEQAMKLDPRYEMAPMWLGSVYASIGRTDKKRDVLLKAVELSPLEPVINVNLAEVLASVGDPQAARSVLQRVLAITPDDASLLRAMSALELTQHNYVIAVSTAERALATEPDGPANIHAVINALMRIEDFDGAAAHARSLPAGTQDRYAKLQWISFRRGSTTLLPELTDLILDTADQPNSIGTIDTLALVGMVELRAGNAERAVDWLGRAAGSPEQLHGNFERMNPASLLILALKRLGHTEQAQRWEEPLLAAVALVVQHESNLMQRHLIEAMAATYGEGTDAAIASLKRAYAAGYRERWQLLYDPRLAPLQADPQMKVMQQRMEEEFAAARAQLRRARGE